MSTSNAFSLSPGRVPLSFASSRKSTNAITSSSFRNCFPSPKTRGKTCLSSFSTDTEKGSTQQRENDDGNERKSVQLLRAINDAKKRNSGGGGGGGDDDDGKIFALMDELEKEAETVEKDVDLIDGKFSLLFTGGATKAKEEEREKKEGAIGSFVTRVTGSSSSSSSSSSARMKKTKSSSSSDSSKNFQIIDLANEVVENRAELLLFNRVPVSVRIFGSCVRKESPSTRPRFSVCFTHAKIEVAGKERIQIPLTRFNARGWIDVTYVDELIRLGVGDKGSRFVTARLRRNSD
jgi:hypothetical protein